MHAAGVNESDWRLPAEILQMAFVDWLFLERWVSRAVLYASHGETLGIKLIPGVRLRSPGNGEKSVTDSYCP